MKRYYVLFEGQVQGVGFRWRLMDICNKMHITGTVKNRSDGRVEAYMQGESADILSAIDRLRHTSPWIIIEDYHMKEVDIIADELGFDVRY